MEYTAREQVNITEEEEIELGKRFPNLFPEVNGMGRPMAFIFGGLPKGWLMTFTKLCEGLNALSKEELEGQHFKQVKEKFGELRAYSTFPYASSGYNMIKFVEGVAAKTCEVCGLFDTTTVKTGGYSWVRTLCIDHREDFLREILVAGIEEGYKSLERGEAIAEPQIRRLDYATSKLMELDAQRKSGKH